MGLAGLGVPAHDVLYSQIMPSDFDFDDVDLDSIKQTAPVQTATSAQALVEQPKWSNHQPLAVEEEEEPDELTIRMSKAHYYWTIVNSRLLEEDDRFAQEVEQEMQDFARERLAALMGATAPKKRGRPSKTQAKAPVSLPRTFVPRVSAQVAAKPLLKSSTPKTGDVPATAKDTGEEVLREIEMADGSKMTKVYKKVVDKDSGKVYYMGYDVGPGGRTSDGQKYTLEQNAAGGQFFRVFNQQTILKDQPRVGKEQYEAQIQAESERHAAATLGAIKSGAFNYGGMGNLIAQAIEKAKRE